MKTKILFLTIFSFIIFSCQSDNEEVMLSESSVSKIDVSAIDKNELGSPISISSNRMNGDLSKSTNNLKLAVYMAEYITTGENDEVGNLIFFNDNGNKQLGGDFVPGFNLDLTDGTNDLSYYVDDTRSYSDLTIAETNNAIDRAMKTWDDVNCSNLGIFEIPFNGRSSGFVARELSDLIFNAFGIPDFFGGSYDYFADVTHAGWMNPLFFDIIAENGSQNILGVAFTIVWIDENGNQIDVDQNGKYDVALREIYYNSNFMWSIGGSFPLYDVETVALHESGHGLSQAHFGKAFLNKGGLHFAPRAVMNAAYSGIQTSIEKTDNAGHCSNWAEWPNN